MDYYLHLFVEDNDMEGFGVSVWRDTCRVFGLVCKMISSPKLLIRSISYCLPPVLIRWRGVFDVNGEPNVKF